MAQTEITNQLPFHAGVLHLLDRDGAPVAAAVVKGTFAMDRGGLRIADEQLPLFLAGRSWGEPGMSSYQYEPESAYYKPATDVVLVGAARPPSGVATQTHVRFSVGPLTKRAVVFGDRFWLRGLGGAYLSAPEPFESVPLKYEKAFGGWDRSDPDPNRYFFEPRNPLGTGFARRFAPGQDCISLPNIEDPGDPITDMSSRPRPAGFGFTCFDWQPRAAFAGTYDDSWRQRRMPLLPADFNPLFFNSAPEGLRADGYLRGDEHVLLENCSAQPFLSFRLPAVQPPRCRFVIAGQPDTLLTTDLDTVVVNTLEDLVILTWRCYTALPRGPEFLRELIVQREE